jgi:hypothetical protein
MSPEILVLSPRKSPPEIGEIEKLEIADLDNTSKLMYKNSMEV